MSKRKEISRWNYITHSTKYFTRIAQFSCLPCDVLSRNLKHCIWCQGLLRRMTALWKRRSGSCGGPIPSLWQEEISHCVMSSISIRKASRTLLRIRWLSASLQRNWFPGTSSREPTTTSATSACGWPSYGAWEFLYATVSCCLSGETDGITLLQTIHMTWR